MSVRGSSSDGTAERIKHRFTGAVDAVVSAIGEAAGRVRSAVGALAAKVRRE